VETIYTIPYADAEADLASECSISNLNQLTESTACSCNGQGVCTVGVTTSTSYIGVATFDFDVISKMQSSNSSTATFNVLGAPVASGVTESDGSKNIEKIITLAYADPNGGLATTCSLSSLSNITESTACVCVTGDCTVGLTGTSDFFGLASFDFSIVSSGLTSNTAMINYEILSAEPECTSLAVGASSPFQAGSGTNMDPYIICSAAQLQQAAYALSKSFKLGNDINLISLTSFVPIGDCNGDYDCNDGDENPFTGSFDGYGKTISNLQITKSDDSGIGLFGVIDSAGTIKDITVKLGSITITDTASIYVLQDIGGIIGRIKDSGTTVSDLYFSGSISVTSNATGAVMEVGGVIGKSALTVANMDNLRLGAGSSINISSSVGRVEQVGGVIGSSDSTAGVGFTRFSSQGTMTLSSPAHFIRSVGGLLGEIDPVEFSNSYSSMAIDLYASLSITKVGGLIGLNNVEIILEHSYFSGSINIQPGSGPVSQIANMIGDAGGVTVNIDDVFNVSTIVDGTTIGTDISGVVNASGGLADISNTFTPDDSFCFNTTTDPDCFNGTSTDYQGSGASANAPLTAWDFIKIWKNGTGTGYPELRD